MSGPVHRDGDGDGKGPGGGGDGLPRVPQQRGQGGQGRQDDRHPVDGAAGRGRGGELPPVSPPASDAPSASAAAAPAEDVSASEPSAPPAESEAPLSPEAHEVPVSSEALEAYDPPRAPDFDHLTLKSLLGAWALAACSGDEALAVELHLTDCAACADEALRLRDAVRLLHQEESLDLDPLLRARVLEGCLGRRPARIPMPEWAGPYGAEAARLDALLRDLGDGYWRAPVALRWFDGAPVTRQFTVGQVLTHLAAVDGLLIRALGLAAPGDEDDGRPPERHGAAQLAAVARDRFGHSPRPEGELPLEPWERTEAHWAAQRHLPGATLRSLWREQTMTLVRTVSFAGPGASALPVDYGDFALPLRDAFLDRAFECWIHAGDIADAVDYPYDPPPPRALGAMVDLAARMLPGALAERRRAGLAHSPTRLVSAGRPGRCLRLEIEGDGGGNWYLPLDSPGATASPDSMVAHVAMDSVEFCHLAAGHVEPERAAAGQLGDRTAIREVLYAAASLSRL
ncbi:maleylpyruvate isomerase N-terminal domain-containing protein [Streptomyces sp. V4-01]|uniref:Maleylpyruvate isomerase N-terminal domain-containing protein n=1 Tax=Actinacidiphila polyblastidii TaxID=3110430 RepID=A0ABU7PK39_9ACTN|nr:maleylpyruvate isomerase N-terminal domain-containing protein [Streptomyces sp. V4-01]